MRRRDFTALLGAAAAWPVTVHAQAGIPQIGFLDRLTASPEFRAGLLEAGYVEGRNVNFRFGNANQSLAQVALELVRLRPAVIVAEGGFAFLEAAAAATSTVPIVYVGGADPVRLGFAASLNRPGGNVTGITILLNDLVGKMLDLLSKVVPAVTTFGYLIGSRELGQVDQLSEAARILGREIIVLECRTLSDLESAFTTLTVRGAGAVLVGAFPIAFQNRKEVLRLVADHRLPAIYAQPAYVLEGGLMSYSYSPRGLDRQAATQYVARILKGEKPGDLPIQQPTKFELAVNLATVKALGLTLPVAIELAIDRAIE
jgi:putative ABC transport system substrate-binding protein